jgi:hypothetical protein
MDGRLRELEAFFSSGKKRRGPWHDLERPSALNPLSCSQPREGADISVPHWALKNSAIISAFVLPLALHAGPITQKPLDKFLIYEIPEFKSGTTTIMFPSDISGPYAKSVAVQEQPNAAFLISFTPFR